MQKDYGRDFERKDMGLKVEKELKEVLKKSNASKNEDGIIQDFNISPSLELTFSVLLNDTGGKCTIKFIKDELNKDSK